ncbi:hypothetical protein F444_22592 [Phytophthora nicotianae P1976]|uniref:Uncharacterized protein n=1 Tax=Phytophthora nicotianae P1976 TaxID=1317066 RepID=A0A080YXB8_PHYNI|nr:hypothetical protein F444_22592 [Phytophthora nicotianae P1976]
MDGSLRWRSRLFKYSVSDWFQIQHNKMSPSINFEYLPKQTISKRGVKTVWVSCGNKEKARATAMLLADWEVVIGLPTSKQYRDGEETRQRKRDTLQENISRARKELVQEEADIEVNRLREMHTEEPLN